jgi:hypothetical protein
MSIPVVTACRICGYAAVCQGTDLCFACLSAETRTKLSGSNQRPSRAQTSNQSWSCPSTSTPNVGKQQTDVGTGSNKGDSSAMGGSTAHIPLTLKRWDSLSSQERIRLCDVLIREWPSLSLRERGQLEKIARSHWRSFSPPQQRKLREILIRENWQKTVQRMQRTRRNMVKCEQCGQLVPRENLQLHMDVVHEKKEPRKGVWVPIYPGGLPGLGKRRKIA